ncbi:MAG: radical SAM protein [Bacteroidales bacterium]|nr:MAG: radical SAM protein [Bacteroidales bacterium]
MTFKPVYIETSRRGLLRERIRLARDILTECRLCPRECKVNRMEDESGICKTGRRAVVSSYSPHFGEESPLVGFRGSGTIFFTHCNLLCNFCQNYDISHEGRGEEVSETILAEMMIHLQDIGCHNINFVTPSHVVPQILTALEIAIGKGLQVPLVYNTSGYDKVEVLRMLDGIVDIFMPDFKFWDPGISKETCNAPDYPEVARQAIKEMHRQVGDLKVDNLGIALRGVLVRHLVMPYGIAGTKEIMNFLSKEISSGTYVNIMPQYRPCGNAWQDSKLARSLTPGEYHEALEIAKKEGISRLDDRN